MKFSEMMFVGNTTHKAVPGKIVNNESACALGMAAIGAGHGYGDCPLHPISTPRTGNSELVFPWLMYLADRPCKCFWHPKRMLIRDIVTHLFDRHVFGFKNWSMEKMGAWVDGEQRKYEPQISMHVESWEGKWEPAMRYMKECAESIRSEREKLEGQQ